MSNGGEAVGRAPASGPAQWTGPDPFKIVEQLRAKGIEPEEGQVIGTDKHGSPIRFHRAATARVIVPKELQEKPTIEVKEKGAIHWKDQKKEDVEAS